VKQTLPTGWHGSLDLVFAHCYGATQLIHSQVKAPLKVQRPFYPEGPGICHSVILHTAGGWWGRSPLSQFHLKPNATALVQQLPVGFIAVIGYKQDKHSDASGRRCLFGMVAQRNNCV